MISFKNIFRHGAGSVCCGLAAALMALPVLTSCEDFFNQESDDVIYADVEHLNNAVDTIYSVTGILNKLQKLADRTILFGEVRGDLVSLTNEASNDLRELASFNVSDDNQYNSPADYYAVINNCNYFIAHVDTAMKNNRNEYIFMKEYCAVKAIRAWTYLQLALNYGRIPFFTEPLLSKDEAEKAEQGRMADIETVCSNLIDDLEGLPERFETEFPGYREIRGTQSSLFWFPINVVRGELYLWKATLNGNVNDYKKAAQYYYKYINERNGTNSVYPIGINLVSWPEGSTSWTGRTIYSTTTGGMLGSERYDADQELITMIAGDSIRAEGNMSELCYLFSSCRDNNFNVSIAPSKRVEEISAAQANCVLSASGTSVVYAPDGLSNRRSGDLRLSNVLEDDYTIDEKTNDLVQTLTNSKWGITLRTDKRTSRNVHIYRRTMVYLHMAEALNRAGYPRMAFQILSEGLANKNIQKSVIPCYHYRDTLGNTTTLADSIFLASFDFPDTRYAVITAQYLALGSRPANCNQMGIHSRGSGFTPMNEYYTLINDTVETNDAKRTQLTREQMVYVDSLILDEEALEFAFEGHRYYDLMRYALRQSNPEATLQKLVSQRNGKTGTTEIANSLTSRSNWFLKWNGKIGLLAE